MGYVDAVANDSRANWRMSENIADWLVNTGILQFGYFVTNNRSAPVRFCPEYLPAYPELLSEVARLASLPLNTVEVEYLIATFESLPLGLVCSLQTSLSLIYSRGRGEAAVYDLVGSYNSGHTSVLLLNELGDKAAIEKFVSSARSVGLDIKMVVILLEVQQAFQLADIPVQSVLRLADIVKDLIVSGRLSERQARAVYTWLEKG